MEKGETKKWFTFTGSDCNSITFRADEKEAIKSQASTEGKNMITATLHIVSQLVS